MATVTPAGAGVAPRAGWAAWGGVGSARRRRQGVVAWLFALPFVLGFGIFMLLPIVSSFLMSFTDFTSSDVQNPLAVGFVGVSQYADLFSNP
jgi:multiple sugar transport system permease protein